MNRFTGELYLDIGGVRRRLKFGTNATAIFCEVNNITLDQAQIVANPKLWTGGELRDMFYAAMAAALYSEGKEPDFNRYTVGDWIDELPQEEMIRVLKTMAEANAPQDASIKKKRKAKK